MNFTADSLSTRSLIEELVSTKGVFSPQQSKYVCHTSTIPLATAIDDLHVRRSHMSARKCEDHSCNCSKNYCITVNSEKEFTPRPLRSNCSCLDYELEPICYLGFLKKFESKLSYSEDIIDPKSVMFCFDFKSILDEKFPAHLKNIGLGGQDDIVKGKFTTLLQQTYWYRKFNKRLKLDSLVKKMEGIHIKNANDRRQNHLFYEKLKQVLHTINGLLVKKFVALSPEISGYVKIAESTAYLFRDLFIEYMTIPGEPLEGITSSIFLELKTFFGKCKEHHDHPDYDTRLGVLNYRFENKSIGRFFGSELVKLSGYVCHRMCDGNGDYTTSIAWDWRFTNLCQTRGMGYLPSYLARIQVAKYWDNITRPVEQVEEKLLKTINSAICYELTYSEVKRNQLLEENNPRDLINQCMIMDLKTNASVEHTVKEGGNLEDARWFLRKTRINKWRFPIRNLGTFEIVDYTPLITADSWDEQGLIDLSSVLFWGAITVATNYFCRRSRLPAEYYTTLLNNGKDYEEEKLMYATLLGINEPGKYRILVKSHCLLNWSLSLASKLSQKILAQIPEQAAGLELGSHDWQHAKRVSGEYTEASFMYDSTTGHVKPEIHFAYTDWTEATDKMKKRIGVQHLKSYFYYIGFPTAYAKLVFELIREPQYCTETVLVSGIEQDYIIRSSKYITEGFMMGNRMTKTILQLAHVSERGITERVLKKKGFSVRRTNTTSKTHRKIIPFDVEGSQVINL